MNIRTVGGEITFLFVQIGTRFADYAFTVQHDNVFKACAE